MIKSQVLSRVELGVGFGSQIKMRTSAGIES